MAGRGCSRADADTDSGDEATEAEQQPPWTPTLAAATGETGGAGCGSRSCNTGGAAIAVGAHVAVAPQARPGEGLSRDEKRGLGSWAGSGPALHHGPRPGCCKCKEQLASVVVRQREVMCGACLENSVLMKIRAVKNRGAVEAGDRVLVAVSGGPSSLALLYGLMQMQVVQGGRASKGKLPFDMVAVHVQEAASHGLDPDLAQRHLSEVTEAVCSTGFSGEVQAVQLADVYCTGAVAERQARLDRLLQAASDATGREDLLLHLRHMLLLRLASGPLSCNKIVTGDTSTSLAIKVIAETAKGRGFSLPGILQLLDCRHGPHAPAHVLPMHEVTAKEAACMCHVKGFKVAAPVQWYALMRRQQPEGGRSASGAARASVNRLSEAFVEGLQANLPSTVSTILRTALNLQAFPWNQLPEEFQQQQQQQCASSTRHGPGKQPRSPHTSAPQTSGPQTLDPHTSDPQTSAPEFSALHTLDPTTSVRGATGAAPPPLDTCTTHLCVLCSCPLNRSELQAACRAAATAAAATAVQQLSSSKANEVEAASRNGGEEREHGVEEQQGPQPAALEAACCSSCRNQILAPMRSHFAAGLSGSGAAATAVPPVDAGAAAMPVQEVWCSRELQQQLLDLLPELVSERLVRASEQLRMLHQAQQRQPGDDDL